MQLRVSEVPQFPAYPQPSGVNGLHQGVGRLGDTYEGNPCGAGMALHPDGAVCIPLTSSVFFDRGICHTPEGVQLPCPSAADTSATVTATLPRDSGIPSWVWIVSGGIIVMAFASKK